MRCLALALTFATGCSFFFVEGPPATPNARPQCTATKGIPTLDGLLGTANLVWSIYYASASDTPGLTSNDRSSIQLAVAVGLLSSAGYYLSALSGNSDVNRCREAQARWDAGK